MTRVILWKAWRDVRRAVLSYAVVPVPLEILGSGFSTVLVPWVCALLTFYLATALGGEEALAGTRDLVRTRALDPRRLVGLRFGVGVAILGVFVGWYAFVRLWGLDSVYWRLFDMKLDGGSEPMEFPPGAWIQSLAALFLAYAASFAAARGCRTAVAVPRATLTTTGAVAVGVVALWVWWLYLTGARTLDAMFRDVAFVVVGAAVLLGATFAIFVGTLWRAGRRP